MATTFTAWKRELRVGDRFIAVAHWRPEMVGQARTITKVQHNGYWSITDGQEKQGWSPFPPASEIGFADDGAIIFGVGQERTWTLRRVEVA